VQASAVSAPRRELEKEKCALERGSLQHMRVKVHRFEGRRLLKQRLRLQVGREERRTLVRVLLRDIPADRARLTQNEAVVVLARTTSKS
jgi:hypothetical protein